MAKRTKRLTSQGEDNEEIRINKFLSEAGVCSRREADRYITEGKVKIDGVVAQMGSKVTKDSRITFFDKPVEREEKLVLIAFNKPEGIVCTTDQREPDNIIDYIEYGMRIYPIGRLDKDSEGLILLTNDGNIVNKILRAENHHEKEYVVTVNKEINPEFLKSMSSGVPILDTVTNPCTVTQIDKYTFNIILTQGLNRQIRRMCEQLGYRVVNLKRIRIMNIQLGRLKVGDYRNVTEKEIEELNLSFSENKNTGNTKPTAPHTEGSGHKPNHQPKSQYKSKQHKSDNDKSDSRKPDSAKAGSSYTQGSRRPSSQNTGSGKSESSKLDNSKSESNQLDRSKSEGNKLDRSRSDGKKFDRSRSDGNKLGRSRSESNKFDSSRPDGNKLDRSRSESNKHDRSRSDGNRFDRSKSESIHLDNNKSGIRQTEDVRQSDTREKTAGSHGKSTDFRERSSDNRKNTTNTRTKSTGSRVESIDTREKKGVPRTKLADTRLKSTTRYNSRPESSSTSSGKATFGPDSKRGRKKR